LFVLLGVADIEEVVDDLYIVFLFVGKEGI